MRMVWHDLLFANWPVKAEVLRPLIPPALEVDTFDGEAWISIVPFRMTGVLPRGVPALPGLSAFAELNVRTYVSGEGKPGVWFLSLDAASRVAVCVARRAFYLPYFFAEISAKEVDGAIEYTSGRPRRRDPQALFAGSYRPTGEVFRSRAGTLEDWLTARYCLYAADGRRRVWRGEIDHAPWPLQRAELETVCNTMTAPYGVELPRTQPVCYFSRRLDVVAWTLDAVGWK